MLSETRRRMPQRSLVPVTVFQRVCDSMCHRAGFRECSISNNKKEGGVGEIDLKMLITEVESQE